MHEIFSETIKVACFEGRCGKWRRPCLVDAVIIEPFAIHPSTERFSRFARSYYLLTVTHVPTGMALCRNRTLRGAVGFINAVRGLDWSFFDRTMDCSETCGRQFSFETAAELFPDFGAFLDAREIWRRV